MALLGHRLSDTALLKVRAMPSFLSRLFAKAPAPPVEPVLYKDCRIYPAPVQDGAVYRIAARIEKDIEGTTRVHHLLRADTHNARDDATAATLAKAQQAIDQLGDTLFS